MNTKRKPVNYESFLESMSLHKYPKQEKENKENKENTNAHSIKSLFSLENIKQVFKKSTTNVPSSFNSTRNKRHWTTYDATVAVSELSFKRVPNTQKELPRIIQSSSSNNNEPTPRMMAKPCLSFQGNVKELTSLAQELENNIHCRNQSTLLLQKLKNVLQKAELSLRHESMQHNRSYSAQPITSTMNDLPGDEKDSEQMIIESLWNEYKHTREKTSDTIVVNPI